MSLTSSLYHPPCPHFGVCGGCALQHLPPDEYKAYKQDKILRSLEHQQISIDNVHVYPLEIVPPQTRRRAVLKACRGDKSVQVGFYQGKSHHVVDLQRCFVVVPEIESFIDPLRKALLTLLPIQSRSEIFVTKCDQGLDVALKRLQPSPLTLEQREAAAQFATAQRHRLTRFMIDGEPLYVQASPTVSFAGFPVHMTPDAFLQASAISDEWLAEKVCRFVPAGVGKMADLFCGRGTLTLPLTRLGSVNGYERDAKALSDLQKTVAKHRLPVSLQQRHLFQEPLSPQELAPFDVIVLNPPREGAMAQARQLALSRVKRVVMVSCNPRSFARDAEILLEGNYTLKEIHPFDQFLWSEHVELVAVFDLREASSRETPSL